jgi:hypothetical protein
MAATGVSLKENKPEDDRQGHKAKRGEPAVAAALAR